MAGQPGPLDMHPAFELGDERRNAGCAHRQTLLRRQAVDFTLDCEDRVDPAHCRDGEWCPLLAAWSRLGEIGQDKELPPSMAPARRLGDRAGTALWIVKTVEPALGIGLQNYGIANQQPFPVFAIPGGGMAKNRGGGGP